jgi:colanic acid/amylovoran biosynthesis glycosyltransferase
VSAIRIAYFINQYPMVSHSFIRREILALERAGIDVERIALRGWGNDLADADDQREREKTRFLLEGGVGNLVLVTILTLVSHPARWISAVRLAFKMARKSLRPWPVHLVYLAEACLLSKWLNDFGADHLHAHFGTNSTEVAMLASVMSGKTYSFTVHGPDEFDMPESIGLREKVRRCAFVVAISSFGCSQLYRWINANDWEKVKVVHCGLERAFYEVATVPVPNRHRLVCVGRLCEQKGQLLLLKAAHLLLRKGVDFELVLAGDGKLRRKIESEIIALGLTAKVLVTGWISSSQVREELLASRALVLPSFAEGLPVVIMEAMSLRRPVLTTYIAGIPELVQQGVNGWLFPSGSVEELAAAMEACLAMPDVQIERMGEQARQRVLERHDIERETKKIATHFRNVIHPPLPVTVLENQT